MIQLWNLLLFHPLLNVLIWLYRYTGSFGWSIILLTLALRALLTPLIIPNLKLTQKMQELNPELAKLKVQFKDDKQGLVKAQAELYKQNGINPAAGCLPQIVQILILIALYSAFNSVLRSNGNLVDTLNPLLYSFNHLTSDFHLTTAFYYLDLVKPDVIHLPSLPFPLPGLFVILAAISQFLSSKMMLPIVSAEQKLAQKTSDSADDIMAGTQEQMLYMFPLMTILMGFQFPSGLVLYWFVFSAISIIQQYFISGPGGLAPWLPKRSKV